MSSAIALVLGMGFGFGVAAVLVGIFFPPVPSLRRLLTLPREVQVLAGIGSLREPIEDNLSKSLRELLVRLKVHERMAWAFPAWDINGARVSGYTVGHAVAQAGIAGLLVGLALFAVTLLVVVGADVSSWWLMASPIMTLMTTYGVGRFNISDEARLAREEFRFMLSAYLGLVSIALLGGAEPDSALIQATRHSDEWAIREIRRALNERQPTVRPWQQLAALGRSIDVSELQELASGIAGADRSGASVSGSLQSRAVSLRNRRLQEAEARAGKNTARMALPTALFALALLFFVLFPVGSRLFDDTSGASPTIPSAVLR